MASPVSDFMVYLGTVSRDLEERAIEAGARGAGKIWNLIQEARRQAAEKKPAECPGRRWCANQVASCRESCKEPALHGHRCCQRAATCATEEDLLAATLDPVKPGLWRG